MALLIFTALITLAIMSFMIARQAEYLRVGDNPHGETSLLSIAKPIYHGWKELLVYWWGLFRKEGSRRAALILARLAHTVGSRVRKLIVLLHRHGRKE